MLAEICLPIFFFALLLWRAQCKSWKIKSVVADLNLNLFRWNFIFGLFRTRRNTKMLNSVFQASWGSCNTLVEASHYPFDVKRQAWKPWIPIFSLWFDEARNQTFIHHFSNKRFSYSTTERLDKVYQFWDLVRATSPIFWLMMNWKSKYN